MPQKNHFMVRLFLSALLVIFTESIHAQKPSVDVNTFKQWPLLGPTVGISNNGAYVHYTIDNSPLGSSTLIIYDARNNRSYEIINGQTAEFTSDSKQILYMVSDSLYVRNLFNHDIYSFSKVSGYSIQHGKKNDWLLISRNIPTEELLIFNLTSQAFQRIEHVTSYTFLPKHESLIVNLYQDSSKTSQILANYDMNGQQKNVVWKGQKASSVIIDYSESKCAFIEGIDSTRIIKCLTINDDNPTSLIDYGAAQIPRNMEIPNSRMVTWRFSNDGSRLFFSLNEKKQATLHPGFVIVWNYKDVILQSEQMGALNNQVAYLFTYVFNNKSYHQLTNKNEEWNIDIVPQNNNDTFIAVASRAGNSNEWNWNPNSITRISLINTLTGERKLTTENSKYPIEKYEISPKGKFFIYYNPEQKNYIAYNIQAGTPKNITGSVCTKWTTYYTQIASFPSKYAAGICGYTEDDKSVLIKDMYNIWLVDLTGKKEPINLTGKENKTIVFSTAISTYPPSKVFARKAPIILKSFNLLNKEIGFYSLSLNGSYILKKLTEGPYSYGGAYDPYSSYLPNKILKAKDVKMYLVQRECSSESPNYFLTRDFISYKEVSNVHPERKFNWFFSELHTYKLNDGTESAGILYTPENFDPNRKYPLILQYYTESTHLTNSFLTPELDGSTLNIPIMIGKGYLVFKPDMHFQLGKLGEGALNSALGAYDYLKEKPYIDSTKIAINGHSMGGYETNYIIAHTNKFQAAISSAGFSDLVTLYGSIWDSGNSQQHILENGYGLMDGTLWEKKNAYISNSPIFDADKICTPLLMMNNDKDGAVNFSQGVALFTALRRLGKVAWMLEYENEGHMIAELDKQIDFQKRMEQFLDHYLKGLPMPEWMEKGMQASQR